jgi:tRNA nucleotidyltransferase (CCA-adding enzyme)
MGKKMNLLGEMERIFPRRVIGLLRSIGEIAEQREQSAYLVGGVVRDLFLGVKNLDIDISIEGEGIEFAHELARQLRGWVKAETRFGTAIVTFRGLPKVDVATCRQEYYSAPGALPEVTSSSLKDDLYRRDFTINAMAVRLNPEKIGELVDFFGGRDDLKKGIVKSLHNESFLDDPTRIFRAVRFAARYNFRIETHTENLIKEAAARTIFDEITIERVRDELVHIFSEKSPHQAIKKMAELHELKFIHSEIKLTPEIEALLSELEEVISWFQDSFPGEKIKKWLIYFYSLLDGLTTCEVEATLRRFHFSEKQIERTVRAKKSAPERLMALGRKESKPSEIYQQLKGLSIELLLLLMAKAHGVTRQRILLYLSGLRYARLSISGEDLKKAGLTPGPEFTTILNKALMAKLDSCLQTREDELEYVNSYLGFKGPAPTPAPCESRGGGKSGPAPAKAGVKSTSAPVIGNQ